MSSALGCVAGNAGLFDGLTAGSSNEQTLDVAVDETCFGTAEEVANFRADIGGGESVPGDELLRQHSLMPTRRI